MMEMKEYRVTEDFRIVGWDWYKNDFIKTNKDCSLVMLKRPYEREYRTIFNANENKRVSEGEMLDAKMSIRYNANEI